MLLDKLPFNRVATRLRTAEKILLVMHKNPDGDTLGAALSLFLVLEKMAKNVQMVCRDEVPRPFLFLYGIIQIKKDLLFGDFDTIVTVDCGDVKMTGFDDRLKKFVAKKQNVLINLDHHPKNDLHKIASINLADFTACSASEIVWELLDKMNLAIDKDMATCLLTGLVNDTGGFKHSNTNAKNLCIAAELLKLGGKIRTISKNISANKSVTAMKLWGITLGRLHYNESLKIVSSIILRQDLIDCKASDDDIAGIVNLINTIPQAHAAVLFYEMPDNQIRASLRTENEHVDVSRLAHIFGGGGHKKAAGFTVDGHLELVENKWCVAQS